MGNAEAMPKLVKRGGLKKKATQSSPEQQSSQPSLSSAPELKSEPVSAVSQTDSSTKAIEEAKKRMRANKMGLAGGVFNGGNLGGK